MSLPVFWLQHDLVQPVLRYKSRGSAFFVATVTLAVLALLLCPQKYESESKLFLRIGRENVALDPTATTGQVISLDSSRETEINSVVEHLHSRYVFERTLDRLDPSAGQASPIGREQSLRDLQSSVTISSPRHSTIVTVRCEAKSPHQAQEIVSTLVDAYLDEHMRIHRTTGSYEFFTQQAELLKKQLAEAQANLRDVRNDFGFSSVDERRQALELQISDVETQIRQVDSSLTASQAKLATLNKELRDLPQALVSQLVGGTPNDGLASMREVLFQLRSREKEMLSKLTEHHPRAVAIRAQVRDVEQALQSEQPDHTETIAAVLAMESAHRDSLEAQQKALIVQKSDVRQCLEELNRHEVQISQATREVQQLEAKYLAYLENSEQARVDRALQDGRISNVSVMQPASLVLTPVSPRKKIILALAMLVGACGGIALTFVSDYVDKASLTQG